MVSRWTSFKLVQPACWTSLTLVAWLAWPYVIHVAGNMLKKKKEKERKNNLFVCRSALLLNRTSDVESCSNLFKIHTNLFYNTQFQIAVLVRFGSVWFWLVTVLLIVWPRSLLLCPIHRKLRIWWNKSFNFCQTDNPRFSCIVYCYSYRQLICKNLQVSEFSFLRKSTKKKSLVNRTWDFP